MKTIALLLVLSLPFMSFAQEGKKDELAIHYRNLGYSLLDETDFTLKQGDEKYIERKFAAYHDFVVYLVPAHNGVYDSNLYIDYLNGDKFIYVLDGTNPSRGASFTTNADDCSFRVSFKNYSSYYTSVEYDYSLIIFGKSRY